MFSGCDTLCSGGISPLVSPSDQKPGRIKITWTKLPLKYEQNLEELVLSYTEILLCFLSKKKGICLPEVQFEVTFSYRDV